MINVCVLYNTYIERVPVDDIQYTRVSKYLYIALSYDHMIISLYSFSFWVFEFSI